MSTKHEPTGAYVQIHRVESGAMYMTLHLASGAAGDRPFNVSMNVDGSAVLVEFAKADDDDLLGRDRFIVAIRDVVERCVELVRLAPPPKPAKKRRRR